MGINQFPASFRDFCKFLKLSEYKKMSGGASNVEKPKGTFLVKMGKITVATAPTEEDARDAAWYFARREDSNAYGESERIRASGGYSEGAESIFFTIEEWEYQKKPRWDYKPRLCKVRK